MANPSGAIPSVQAGTTGVLPATSLDFHGLGTLKIYTMLEHEMVNLNTQASKESAAIGFFCGCGGAFIGGLLAALVSLPSTPRDAGIFIGVVVVLGVLTIFFAIQWRLAWKSRSAMIAEIKARAPTPVKLQLSAGPPTS